MSRFHIFIYRNRFLSIGASPYIMTALSPVPQESPPMPTKNLFNRLGVIMHYDTIAVSYSIRTASNIK
jgi:hypothetical protein